jgi:hypothetical protein
MKPEREEVYVSHIQHDTYKEYEVGSCEPRNCNTDKANNCDWNVYENGVSVRDWKYGEKTCRNHCQNIALCSGLNPLTCPLIGEDVRQIWDERIGPPHVVCIYPTSTFRLKENIDKYASYWGDDDNYNNILMAQYCSGQVSSCPEGIDSMSFKRCSRMVSTGLDGVTCREWGRHNKSVFDKTAAKYCSENNTLDCSCFTEKSCSFCSHHSYLSMSELSGCDGNKKGIDLDQLALSAIEDITDHVKEDNETDSQSSSVLGIVIALVVIIALVIIVLLVIKWSIGTRKKEKGARREEREL